MSRRPPEPFVEGSRGARTFPDVAAENYWFRRHQAAYALAARALGEMGEGPVLDVGCGEGYGAAMVATHGPAHAVDRDPDAVLHAAAAYPGIHVVCADACALPYRAGSFGAVVAMQVIEHLFCADGFLRRVRELLQPDGVLLLSTPNRATFSPGGEASPFHVYEYTAEELEALLRVHFERVDLAGLHHGSLLRTADRSVGGSLQHRLMATPFDALPLRFRTLVRSIRSRHFSVAGPEGSLDLLATARRRAT